MIIAVAAGIGVAAVSAVLLHVVWSGRHLRIRQQALVLTVVAAVLGPATAATALWTSSNSAGATYGAGSIAASYASDPTCAWANASSVDMTWTATGDTNVTGYAIKRTNSWGGTYTTAGTASGRTTTNGSSFGVPSPLDSYLSVNGTRDSWESNNGHELNTGACTRYATTAAGPATSNTTTARAGKPAGVAVDRNVGSAHYMSVYWADENADVVYRYNPSTGSTSIVVGNGLEGNNGSTGTGTSIRLFNPKGLGIDSNATNLYIADSGNHRVLRYTVAASSISLYAGTGAVGSSGDGGLATDATLNTPTAVAPTGGGGWYIADSGNHKIRVTTDTTPRNISTYAGTGAAGFSGDGGAATSATLNNPTSIHRDGNTSSLIIADYGNARIRRINSTTGNISTIAGTGTAGNTGDGGAPLSADIRPDALWTDSSRNVYFADTVGHVVRMVNNGWTTISNVAGTGTAGHDYDNQPATNAKLWAPTGGAYDANNDIYIAEAGSNRVRRVSAGTIHASGGAGNGGYSGDGSAATAALVNNPSGLAFDASNNLYIADTANNRVRMVAAGTGVITTIAGTGTAGDTGDGGAATSATLNAPSAVVASGSDIYIADTGNNKIRRISSGTITTVAGTGGSGSSGDGGAATSATLNGPLGVAVSGSDVYIADAGNNKIRKISGGTITTFAGTGTPGNNGDGTATTRHLNSPSGVGVTSTGEVYIADTANHLIRRVSTSGSLTTVVGTGAAGTAGDRGVGTSAQLSSPKGLVVTAGDTVYIADTGNHRVGILSRNGHFYAITGTAQGSTGDGALAPSARFDAPTAVAVKADGSGDVFVAEIGSDRVRRLTRTP